ncbi:GAF and ANTAR domain-containing protein [Agrococcus beijingensis]|uniref:GAF and ANTAR domain-containing protein n=1 Tax=Agrococcus beijingensis TaxID=3068634 RepID=UPI00274096DC|nr:GAF and ANTAR domain-containing protein [Agrococcus sp. REN33]
MIDASRQGRVDAAFMTLAETLTSEYDVVELLHVLMDECLKLLDVQAAGLLLSSGHGDLELVASTSEGAAFVEIMQLNAGEGPCVECFETGEAVSVADVATMKAEWAEFRDAALREGYHSSYGLPLRVRSQSIGALGLFRTSPGELDPAEAQIARGLANIASIGILHERVLRESSAVNEQLRHALDSRVVIEQAKGVLAASAHVDVERAFDMLRAHARHHNLSLHDVARAVVERTMTITQTPRGTR